MATPNHASDEMAFFSELMRRGSLAATARELGVTPPAVSKRLSQLEARLGVTLLHRTTRRISPTAEGEAYLAGARRILTDIEEVERQLTQSMVEPKGLLRVNATLGFGRNHVAPIASRFCRAHPHVQLQLQLTVDPPPLNEDAFDVCVRFGEPPDARVIARRIASNRRLLCASPAYLKRRGTPRSARDLVGHDCISIRHGGEAYGVWRLRKGKREEVVKVGGAVMTNDGDVAVQWALDGHGILMRAEWDLAHHLRSGRLKPVLESYQTPPADIYALYPQRHQLSARVRAFVDFLSVEMGESVR
jgi:DNA-binding transcriptional LysR family regulator